jgi:glycosyltransferase involved in cell wall biosynthesis
METQRRVEVAVLLTTYNGASYVEQQIRSLKDNVTPFTLHWIDDHSDDDTQNAVRASALSSGIVLKEWHRPYHQGFPGTFFQLLECVEADIYLFCDQDDIWQPGKIDATVTNLLPDIGAPVLCFSHALLFRGNAPEVVNPVFDVMGHNLRVGLEESRLFTFNPAQGNTTGLTRPLRDIFLSHKEIAREYAPSHDWWIYIIAVATGTVRLLTNVPTTLYRFHDANLSAVFFSGSRWRLQHAFRRWASRQAEGFCLASATLTPGHKLDRLLALARVVATLDKRQSPRTLLRLARHGAMPPNANWAAWLAAACLCSNAKP